MHVCESDHVADAHVGVSCHCQRVELTTAQVQEGTAAIHGLAGGADACSRRGFDREVVSRVVVVPFHCHDVGAAVQLGGGVLGFTGGCRKVEEVLLSLFLQK